MQWRLPILGVAALCACSSFEAAPAGDAGAASDFPRAGLVLAFDFEDASPGSVFDASGLGNTGTSVGTRQVTGAHGRGFGFGGGASVSVQSSPSLDIGGAELTLAFWAFLRTPTGITDQIIVRKPWTEGEPLPPYYQWGVELDTGSKELELWAGTTGGPNEPIIVSVAAPFERWVHLAFVVTGGRATAYLNGAAVRSAAIGPLVPRGTGLLLGVDGLGEQPFAGSLDELRIYARALAPAEVARLAKP
jgi:hypothetical protein